LVVRGGKIVERRQLPVIPYDAVGARRAGRPARVKRPEALRLFERVMLDAVEVHLRMETSWRLFFSGGIDSSILLMLAQQILGRPVQALTVGYSDADDSVDESREAMRIAERAGAECVRVEMSPDDFWTLAPRIAAAIDDPTADAAVLPTYVLGRATFEAGAKVALTGEGADEIFGGYSRYRKATLPLLFRKRRLRRGVFSNTGISVERFGGWDAGIEAAERRERAVLHTRLQVLQAVDVKERLPNSLLIKLDRCLMAHSVEGRTPFLDKEVVRFAASLPDELKATLRFGKVLLRDWLAGANPDTRPYARKRGFEVPVGEWIHARRAALAGLVARQPGIAAVFSRDEVARIFDASRQAAQPAWSLLFYALWHSHHVLGVAPQGDIAAVLGAAADARAAVPA
jgi:asparagine synthase (glutamine-hydrolysing)